MKPLTEVLIKGAGFLVLTALLTFLILWIDEARIPSEDPGTLPYLEQNMSLLTVNTTRLGSEDAFLTAVAVSQAIYPATEEDNTPGAVILVNRNNLAEVMVAASRVQHFPVNAPILYVQPTNLPQVTRRELLRLKPEGVMMDGNVQVYIVGGVAESVVDDVRQMGYKVRQFTADTPEELALRVDTWSSTQHGDHKNDVVIANLDSLEAAIPSMFWNAHMGDGLAFVTNRGIPDATRQILENRLHGPWIYVFGDETVVSDQIVRELGQYGQVTRMRGNTPGAVSSFFAGFHDTGKNWGYWVLQGERSFGWGIAEAGHNAIFVNLNGPEGWVNAVPATTFRHMGKHAPVLILDNGRLTDTIRRYLEIIRPYPAAPQQQLLNHGIIVGGTESISYATQVEIDRLLEARPDVLGPEGVSETAP